MQTVKISFVTYETSPGFYCCDVYRNDVRVVAGAAYSSPDTALKHRLENYAMEVDSEQFSDETEKYCQPVPPSIREVLLGMYDDETRIIFGCKIMKSRFGGEDFYYSEHKAFSLDEAVERLKGWQV
jgi:hypothetical protein